MWLSGPNPQNNVTNVQERRATALTYYGWKQRLVIPSGSRRLASWLNADSLCSIVSVNRFCRCVYFSSLAFFTDCVMPYYIPSAGFYHLHIIISEVTFHVTYVLDKWQKWRDILLRGQKWEIVWCVVVGRRHRIHWPPASNVSVLFWEHYFIILF